MKKMEEYHIAYFDILGYKDFFANKENNISEFLNCNISLVNDITNKLIKNTVQFHYPFKLKLFSDNFMILLKKTIG